MLLYLVSEAMNDDVVKRYIQQGMEQANEQAISRAAKVQVWYNLIYILHMTDL